MAPKSYNIAVIFGPHSPKILSGVNDFDPEDIYFGPLLRAFEGRLNGRAHIDLVTVKPSDYLAYSRDHGYDALLILSTQFAELPSLAALYDAGVKFIAIGASPDDAHSYLPAIDCANREGGESAAHYLIELGHKDMGCVNLAQGHMDQSDRMHGFMQAASSAGRPIDYDLSLIHDDYRYDLFPDLVDAWFSRLELLHKMPTAILACDFNMAETVMAVLNGRVISVPGEVSVLGFDDPPAATRLVPQLTTVRQPVDQMGRRAAERLLAALDAGEGMVSGGVEILPTEIVVRGSVGAPRSVR